MLFFKIVTGVNKFLRSNLEVPMSTLFSVSFTYTRKECQGGHIVICLSLSSLLTLRHIWHNHAKLNPASFWNVSGSTWVPAHVWTNELIYEGTLEVFLHQWKLPEYRVTFTVKAPPYPHKINNSKELLEMFYSLVYTACHDSQPSVQISALLALRTLSKQEDLKKVRYPQVLCSLHHRGSGEGKLPCGHSECQWFYPGACSCIRYGPWSPWIWSLVLSERKKNRLNFSYLNSDQFFKSG